MSEGTDEPVAASGPSPESVPELDAGRVPAQPGSAENADSAAEEQLAEELAIDEIADDPSGEAGTDAETDATSDGARRSRRGRHTREHRAWVSTNLQPDSGDGTPAKKKHRKAPWWELPALVVGAVIIAILVKSFIVQPFFIPSESMEKTLHGCQGCRGDRILVNKTIYDFRDPHPGDIVVFHAPPGWDDEPSTQPPSNPILKGLRGFGQLIGFVPPDGLVLVKRVIATGGQTVRGVDGKVQISDDGGTTYRTLDEPYVYLDGPDNHGTFGPITVPKGRLWVMGDHRNDSADSRFHCQTGGGDCGAGANVTSATVPVKDVIGKAFVIAWPPSRWRTLGTPATFKQHAEAAAVAVSGGMPVLASLSVVVPLGLLRRRRRRIRSPR